MPHPEWSRVTATLKPEMWERARPVHPEKVFAKYVCSGICHGFHVGFDYHRAWLTPVHRNMKSASKHGEVVEKYLGEEREAQRVLGPFKRSCLPESSQRQNRENGDLHSTFRLFEETVLMTGLQKSYALCCTCRSTT